MMERESESRSWIGLVVAGLMILTLGVGAAEANERSVDEVSRMTRQISQEIYSPYCPGKTLAMCPSGNALDARMEIQHFASEGLSEEEIKAIFLERYGEEYALVQPPARDNLLLLGGILGGLGLAIFAVGMLARRRLQSDSDDDEEGGVDPAEGAVEGDDGELEDGYLDELRAEYND